MVRKVIRVIMAQMKEYNKFPQVQVKEYIKRYDQRAIDTVLSQCYQLDNKTIFDPLNANQMSEKETRVALKLLNMIK